MKRVLVAAGCYQLMIAVWAVSTSELPFSWLEISGNHPELLRGIFIGLGAMGLSVMVSARRPFRHPLILLFGFLKFSIGVGLVGYGLAKHPDVGALAWLAWAAEAVGCVAFSVILWFCLKVHVGIPVTSAESYTVKEASKIYRLSTGQTLAEASESQMLVLVFLRHFGCTFTRRILRGLEEIEIAAREQGAELVLVHMLQSGKESQYLSTDKGVLRIADPRCELYRAFGLGKGRFLELFGPLVWLRATASIIQGCGVGHLAGDGLQMPGAFLFQDGKILAAQPAQSAADLPDIPELFKQLPPSAMREKVLA